VRQVPFALGAAVASALLLAAPASAVPPTLTSVGQSARHPTATFSAPRADSATIYFSTKPDRATDGRFLSENIATLDSLTDSEIQAGRWLSEDALDPGRYYVLLRASPDFDLCWITATGMYDPACADGFSNMQTLDVPKPTSRYSATVSAYRYINRATLELRAAPLGEARPYKVCYRWRTGRNQCVRGVIRGYSWSSSASDLLSVNTRPLPTIATFNWYVGTTRVASKRARVH
jgi:hypothetical protein